jgi:hypothetical protein
MGMGAPAGPIQQTTPATGGKGQPGPGAQQPNRPGPMPAQGGKGLPSGQPMQPQGPYGQRPEDMYKNKDFNRGPNFYGNQGPYGQPYPGFVPGQPTPQVQQPLGGFMGFVPGQPTPQVQQMDPATLAKLQQMAALRPQVQPQIGAPIQGLGQVPAVAQGLGSLGNLGGVGTKLGGLM